MKAKIIIITALLAIWSVAGCATVGPLPGEHNSGSTSIYEITVMNTSGDIILHEFATGAYVYEDPNGMFEQPTQQRINYQLLKNGVSSIFRCPIDFSVSVSHLGRYDMNEARELFCEG